MKTVYLVVSRPVPGYAYVDSAWESVEAAEERKQFLRRAREVFREDDGGGTRVLAVPIGLDGVEVRFEEIEESAPAEEEPVAQ